MKLFLVSFLSFICIYPCFAIKPINSRLDAEIIRIQIDPDDLDPDPFAYKMKANAILHINNRLSDSILLKVDHPVTLPVKGLGIDSIIITTPSKDTLPYNYNGEILTIKIRNEKLIRYIFRMFLLII